MVQFILNELVDNNLSVVMFITVLVGLVCDEFFVGNVKLIVKTFTPVRLLRQIMQRSLETAV